MDGADLIAVYGAFLATVLAMIQISQWLKSRRFLSIKHGELFNLHDSTLEITIANRGEFPVTLDYVAVGFSGRWWRSIWRRDPMSLSSVSKIVGWGDDGAIFDGQVDGLTLHPGEMVKGGVTRIELEKLDHGEVNDGLFSYKPCFWIEHSQSDKGLCEVISWQS